MFIFPSKKETKVRVSDRFYMKYIQVCNIQNLNWSAELLENFYEQDLLDKISEKLICVPKYEYSRPLVSFYIMLEITSSTIDTVRTMEHRVTSLSITYFEEEKITIVVSQLRSSISRLIFFRMI